MPAAIAERRPMTYRVDKGGCFHLNEKRGRSGPAPKRAAMKGRKRRNERSGCCLLQMLWEKPAKMVSQANETHVIGHRVVHRGADFHEAVRVTDELL